MKRREIAVIGLRGFPGVQGGVERHSEALYPLLDGFRFNIFRRKPYLTEGSRSASYPNIRFTDLPSTTVGGFEALFHTFISALCLIFRRPALVHVHNIGPGLMIPLLRMAGLRVVMTYHSPNYEHSKWGRLSRMLLKAGEYLSLRFSDRIIFVNRAQMARFPEKIRRKSVFIPNGIKHTDRSADTSYIDSLGLKSGGYILGVGRLTPEKGFETLVEAVNRLDRNVKLVIAGGSDNGTSYSRSLREADRKGRLTLTGNVFGEQLRQLYSHASLFVLSSVNEGFPLVLLEAMDYGLPILASDIPGARQLPMLAESSFFRAADPEALRNALESFIHDPSRLTTSYDLGGYSWEDVSAATAKVYRSLVGR